MKINDLIYCALDWDPAYANASCFSSRIDRLQMRLLSFRLVIGLRPGGWFILAIVLHLIALLLSLMNSLFVMLGRSVDRVED